MATLTVRVEEAEYERLLTELNHTGNAAVAASLTGIFVVCGNRAIGAKLVLAEGLSGAVKNELGLDLDRPAIRAYMREEEAADDGDD